MSQEQLSSAIVISTGGIKCCVNTYQEMRVMARSSLIWLYHATDNVNDLIKKKKKTSK